MLVLSKQTTIATRAAISRESPSFTGLLFFRTKEVFFSEDFSLERARLVSHYSAIGDTISRDGPYSAIGFRGKLFLRYPPWVLLGLSLLTAIGHF